MHMNRQMAATQNIERASILSASTEKYHFWMSQDWLSRQH